MNKEDKNIRHRLKRTEGQVRGILKMIEEEKRCEDILTQLRAVRSGIDRVMGFMVAENLKTCLETPDEDPIEQAQKVEQAIQFIVKK